MKITHVALKPSDAVADGPAVSPELLASVGARYSRSNDGLEAILAKTEGLGEQEAIEGIFRHISYGHNSIMSMVPLTFFLDGISMYAAYRIFAMCPVAAGQESSSRYIAMDSSSLMSADELGIPLQDQPVWQEAMDQLYQQYANLSSKWERMAPADLSEAKRRNFALDRSRNMLPLATRTNMMLVQSGQEWAKIIRTLLSSGEFELNRIGRELYEALQVVAPRCAKHATFSENHARTWRRTFFDAVAGVTRHSCKGDWSPCRVNYHLAEEDWAEGSDVGDSIELRMAIAIQEYMEGNRYDDTDPLLSRAQVCVQWSEMALAEVRDLNRHRQAKKWAPMIPQGFVLPESPFSLLEELGVGKEAVALANRLRAQGDECYPYYLPLGATIPFEMTMPLDNFLYIYRLRTGEGAHFAYAKHMQDAYNELKGWLPHVKQAS